ncbi:MAG: methyltransferase domain-containing protein [Rhodobacteraceae bacterium]|nr:methyltransferase domain-containing protein [Paracoccaceae bacterium]
MATTGYIHTFTDREQNRLIDQAEFLARYHHVEIDLSACRRVIEVGCGVGAQMRILLRNWPAVTMTGIDNSRSQLDKATQNLRNEISEGRAALLQGAGDSLPVPDNTFEGAVVFWVLEHVAQPIGILGELFRVMKPGARVFITEVFDTAVYTYPHCTGIETYFQAFVALQRELGGDPDAAMRVPGLAARVGFTDIEVRDVSPMLDARMTDARERSQFLDYFQTLLLSGSDELLARNKIEQSQVDAVRTDFVKLGTDPDAVFHYGAKLTRARKP